MDSLDFTYEFRFPDQMELKYSVSIDLKGMKIIKKEPQSPPDWTRLENQKCAHCPLKSKEFPYCPVAVNLSQIIDSFKGKTSYDEATLKVVTKDRNYEKSIRLQDGIFSLIGLIMPFSGCPHMKFLRPMARFHLPISTPQETIVRSVSFYLLRQYFIAKKGGKPDLKLERLNEYYKNIHKVNEGMIQRLRGVVTKDPELNAFVILTSIADLLSMAISKDLSIIEPLFSE